MFQLKTFARLKPLNSFRQYVITVINNPYELDLKQNFVKQGDENGMAQIGALKNLVPSVVRPHVLLL